MIYSLHHIGALFIPGRRFAISEKRTEKRGPISRIEESRRQDGRYAYQYRNLNGSWYTLVSFRVDWSF